MDSPHFLDRTEFADNAERVRNRTLLDPELEPWFATRLTSEAISCLDDAGVAWSRFGDVCDLPNHPALRRIAVETPQGRKVLILRPAGRDQLRAGPIPAPRQHADALRLDFDGGGSSDNDDDVDLVAWVNRRSISATFGGTR